MAKNYQYYGSALRRMFLLICFLTGISSGSYAQLTVTPGVSAATLISSLAGQGLTVTNVALNCPTAAYGTFSNGNTTNVGITNGILLTTGSAVNAIGPNNSTSMGTCNGTSGSDPQLVAIEPMATQDLCVLEFDIVPQCNQLTIKFVFGSEEYPEFVSSSFNDAFGFFITGPSAACAPGGYNNTNVATLPNNITPVSIDNVNNISNSAYYVNNTGGATIQYDGFTTVLTRTINLCPCQTYHFKMAIADAGDCYYDSGVFIDFLSCTSVMTSVPTSTPATCSGCNGTASANVTGGVGPYTYSWAPSGGTGATATGLCPGTYTVTVNDALTCTPAITATVVVGSSGGMTLGGSQTNILCNGQCTGAATVTVSGGTAPYTYSWAPSGGTAATTTGRCAGTYTVTVTDANGCVSTRTFNITQPPALTTTGAQTNVLCNGLCTGSATVTPSGGTGPYTYSWAPAGGTGATAAALCAGTYTCTVTDANGCTTTRTFSITQPPALTTTGGQTNVLCNGLCTGSATVTPSGGTGPYTYSWAPAGGTGTSASALCAGTYTCTVTDANGCTTTRTFNITQPPALTTTGGQTNILCNGLCTGSATVTPSGGTGPYTYSWAPSGGTAATTTGRCAGTYTCTVTDANGCSTTRTFNITQPPAITTTGGQTNVLCNGLCTGSATVTPSGGTGPYTYSWAPAGGTGTSASALCAGTYTVTVTDANGCTTTRTFNITQPPALTTTGGQTNVLCNGLCTGSATVTPSGGTGPYTYSWAPSGGTAATTTGRCAGTYTCTVTDANGCTTTRTFNITQPPAITTTGGQTNILCNGLCTGSATVTPSGGTGPYTYSWAPAGGTGTSASALCAGTYTVTVTDANGCTTTRTFNITQPPALTTTGGQTNVLCNGLCTGSATVTPSGGTGPYTYSWAPAGGTGATASALCAGTYTATVTDASGCTTTRTFNITQPPALTTTGGQTNVLCNGLCTGSATVTPSGGTGPYTFSWAPAGGTGATASALCAGTYTATITDANGCTATRTFNITQPPAITTTGGQTNVLCNGLCTGSATVTPSGGTGPYTYSWAPAGGTGATASALCAGTYTATVTDANGCTTTRTFSITQPPAITTTGGQTNVLCNGQCTGSATVTPSGGTGPYTYSWAPAGGTGTSAAALCAGTYTVTVTDANGCTTTRTFNITQPPALTTTGGQTNVLCNGQCTGSATVTPSGGTGPYTYSWAPSGGTAATTTGRCAGTYTCTVTDANGCTTTRTFNITQPPALTASAVSTPATCGNNNGSATVTASGGTGPYTYNWAPSGGTGTTAPNLGAGSYTVTVIDANGCTTTANVTVASTGGISASITATVNIACFGGNTGSATVTPSGGTGPFTYSWSPSGGTGATASGLTAGSYTATVTDVNGCIATASVTLTQPPQLTATASATPVSCNGGTNGTASVTASGGVGPYTYNWAPSGGTGSTASGLGAGTYTVTVTDANGCVTTATAAVTQPTALTAVIAPSTNVSCNGGSNGSATVTAGGGTGPYTYNWAPSGGTGATASGLAAGTYTVTVTDANSCTVTAVINITQPTPVTGVTSSTPATCGNANGIGTVVASGGTGPYTYNWAPAGGTGASTTGVLAGTYTVTITDANGCTGTATVNIINAGSPTVTITASTNILCFGGTNGSATASASGGTGPYTYAWTPSGGTGTTASGLAAGSYTITVTDANGCTANASVTLTQPPQLTATASATPVSCNGGTNGTASVTASGGVGPYTYNWAPSGGTGSTASGLGAGTYTVTVTDANGCTTTASATVTQPTVLTAVIAPSTNVSCNGGSNGSATVTAGGGTGPYTYNWAPSGGTGATASGLAAGSYTVTVTDANSCTVTAVINITQPTPVTGVTSSTPATCGNANGIGTVVASGGTGPYTYNWAPAGGTGSSTTGVLAGTYTVTITDANGCTGTATVNIINAGSPTVTITASTNILCFGGTNGSATASASGGTGPYTYAWTPSGGTGTTASGLAAGSYTITVTDANGCTANASVTLTQPPQLTATASATPVSCNGGTNGTASVTASGGVGPYTYNWAPSGGTGSTASGLGAGTYTVTVTDANGCTTTASATVTQPTVLTAVIAPSTNVSCNGGSNGSATVTAGGGTAPYTYNWAPSGGTGATASGLAAGSYTVTVTDANSCTVTAVINITQPTPVTGVTSSTPATCGNANGIGTVVASGGTGPYTYNWAPAGGTGASTTGVVAGAYTVTITDANGCNGTATVNIINAGSPTVTITASTNVTCFGANDGTASASATGGTTPYTWAWTPTGGNTANATALGPNTYTCTVTDANNCTAIATVTITEPPQLLASLASQTDVLCFGAATGAATVNATGGTNPLTYAWAPTGGNAATATGLTAGSYTCTITDANNCTTTQTVTITEPPQLVLAVAGFDATCNGACNGQVVVIPTGGVQPYNFLWNTGCTSPSCNSMCVGSYSITVTDANGCIASDSTAVNEPAAMQAVMSSTAANCNQADGSATVTPSGGTGPYTYSWAPAGGTGATTTGVFAGNYTVTITDANNCTLIDSVNVPNAPGVAVAVVSTTDATCAGDCNGQATISASGGTGPYTIAWPSGGNALTETGLCAGTYIVNVNDANGCPSSATVTILQPQPLQVAVPTPAAICIGQSVTLSTVTSGGTPAYTEVWTPAGPVVSPTATTTYTVTVTDANGCTVTPQTVTVNVNPPLNVVPSANVSICSGAQASLSAAASGGDGSYTYTWSPATSPATGSSVNASPGTTTIYTVTVTDGCGTPAATANITVTVFAPPAVTFSVDNQSGCAPLCVSFTNSTPGATSCAWDFGDNTTDNTTCTPVHCYNTPGSYDIILNVIDGNGCASTLTMPNYITVNPNPVAEFSFGPQPTTILNPTILFTDESNGATAWSWTFGDLLNSSSTLQNPAFTYPDTGCYDVTLTVTNAFGCSSDTTHPVCIDGEFVIYVPNAFTPNDDNKNDIFNAQGMGIDPEHFEMWIFDRWGNMIFYTDNLNKGWDGRANYGDNIAQIDTYVWKIKCTDILGQKHNLLGKVSLIK